MSWESMSSSQDPLFKPLSINDQYAVGKSPRMVSTAPESNSRAVISALLGLQEKIHKLEVERTEAEGNLKSLANETAHYRDLIKSQHPVQKDSQIPSTKHSQELQGQLACAESRSNLLEKQLEYMRNMVRSAEEEKDIALKQQKLQSVQQTQMASEQVRAQRIKIGDLEREHAHLKATQALAENKIKDLENKMKEEKHQREILQFKTAQLETETESKKVLSGENRSQKMKRTKKKKSKISSTKPKRPVVLESASCSKQPYGARHLRLKMENVPFVAGKAITPSHNVNANLQNLIALMKTHNSAWCGNASLPGQLRGPQTKTRRSHSSSSSDNDLAGLLLGLQDEFGQLAFEHQEITKQMHETKQPDLQEDLEQECAQILARMEAKGDQINKLKKHKEKVAKMTSNNNKSKLRREVWSPPSMPSRGSEVKVITTVKTQGKGVQSTRMITPDPKINQYMLHNMKKLQTSLSKDDVTWS